MTTISKVNNNITLLGSYFEANRTDGGGFAVVRRTSAFDNSLTKYYNSVVDIAKKMMKDFEELSKENWRSALDEAIETYNLASFGAKVRNDSGGQLKNSWDECVLVDAILLVGIALDFIKDDEYNGFLTQQHIAPKQSNVPFNVLMH